MSSLLPYRPSHVIPPHSFHFTLSANIARVHWHTKGKQVHEEFPFCLDPKESGGTMDPCPGFSVDMVLVP